MSLQLALFALIALAMTGFAFFIVTRPLRRGLAAAPAAPAGAGATAVAPGAGEAPAQTGVQPWPRRALAGTALAVVLLAGGLYAWLGRPDLVAVPSSGHQAEMPSPAQLEQLAAEISAHLKSNPQDGQGWMMLARLYAASDRLPEALDAYRKAVALSPNDANLLVEFANALALSQDRELDGEPVQLIERALKLDPDQPLGLALKAIERFKQKDYPTAIALWEHTLRVLPPGNAELTAQLESNIEEARRLAAAAPAVAAPAPMQSAAAPSATRPSAATGPRAAIEGVVRLDPALAARTRPEDTVFVYARAVEGPRMPLALIKARVRDLPLAFRLDETMAMMPSTSLAQYPEVRLEARISRSGEALPQSGDLEGSLSPVRVGARGVRIDISRALP